MIVTVHITAEDIACGCHAASNCPSQRAITRLIKPEYLAMVCSSHVALLMRDMSFEEVQKLTEAQREQFREIRWIKAPSELMQFMQTYDRPGEQTAEPVSFELDIPEKYLLEAA